MGRRSFSPGEGGGEYRGGLGWAQRWRKLRRPSYYIILFVACPRREIGDSRPQSPSIYPAAILLQQFVFVDYTTLYFSCSFYSHRLYVFRTLYSRSVYYNCPVNDIIYTYNIIRHRYLFGKRYTYPVAYPGRVVTQPLPKIVKL